MAEEVLETAPMKFALVGLSMGGIVSLEIYRTAPCRVKGLALMNTNFLPETPSKRLFRNSIMRKVRIGGLKDVMLKDLTPKYIEDGPNRRRILDLCLDMAMKLGPHVFLQQSKALMTRMDYSYILKDIDVPTLVLCGNKDKLCSVEQHKSMAAMIQRSVLTILEGVGHLSTLEAENETCIEINKWIKSLDGH